MALFISFEGGEGSGKSTQAQTLAGRLQTAGYPVLLVQEPGYTQLGQYLRDWLKRESITPTAELFLFVAARAELVAKVIRPALTKGKIVITDRYSDSTVAYQGHGRGISLKHVNLVNNLATQGTLPDLTFFLDFPPEEGLIRAKMQTITSNPLPQKHVRNHTEGRKFEEETLSFHERVRTGYLKLASEEPDRWRVIDATKTVEQVSEDVWRQVQKLLAESPNLKQSRDKNKS